MKATEPAMKSATPVDDYLDNLPADVRNILEDLRRKIKAAAPKTTETISYRIPMYKLDGRPLVGFAAFKDHCSFFVMSPKVIRMHTSDLKRYKLGKGTVQFSIDKPLPAALVKKLVRARVAEIKRPK